MVVTRAIKGIIDQYCSEISTSVPLVDILYDLRFRQILSNEEVKKLRDDCKTDKERAFEFLKVLESRSDDNFYQFCHLLQESDISSVRELGERLEKEANKTAENKEQQPEISSKPKNKSISNQNSPPPIDIPTFQISNGNGETESVKVTNPDSPAQQYFNLIVDDIGTKWRNLARVLHFNRNQIKTIKANNADDVNEQCAEMLYEQHDTKGSSFTKLKLIEALYKANLRAVAEKINIDPDEATKATGIKSQKALSTNNDQG
ncbi:hypothetical protein TrispH2_011870 [Trichoplax sp. H2]|nr:hypothetical protein TrispH2_011870 [Trichoplax sp. H2]|eukprot:RDD36177.1 hypothetical protein TrispH2_011870 [Trichoplax sp. H2]